MSEVLTPLAADSDDHANWSADEGDHCPPVRVGIAGLGRSGWGIHAPAIAQQPNRFRLVAVTDDQPTRRAEAVTKFGCTAHRDIDQLVRDPNVDLVVIATPNHMHARHAIAALDAGKHVLCEKPMAASPAEAEAMIESARRNSRILTVFNNRRFDPHFLKVREIVASGALGQIVQVRLVVHAFTRRWDWQTLKEYGGGMLSNIGAHFLDLLLSFFPAGELPQVFCHLDRVLTLGDADDHCVVMLRSVNGSGPLVQMELSNACALPQDNWLIMGDRGTLSGTFSDLTWRTVDVDDLATRTLERAPRSTERAYNRDTLSTTDHHWTVPSEQAANVWNHWQFYRRLYATLRDGAPLVVDPREVHRCMQLIAACHAAAASTHAAENNTAAVPTPSVLNTPSMLP